LNKPEPFEDKEFRDLWLENINRYATLNKLLEPLERAKQLFPEQKEFTEFENFVISFMEGVKHGNSQKFQNLWRKKYGKH
jgi:hypothetical protein